MRKELWQSLELVLENPSADSWNKVLEQILLISDAIAGKIFHFQPHPVVLAEVGAYPATHEPIRFALLHGHRLMGVLELWTSAGLEAHAELGFVSRILASAIAQCADPNRFESLMKGALHDLRGPASRTNQLAQLALAAQPAESVSRPLQVLRQEVAKLDPLLRELGAYVRAATASPTRQGAKWSDVQYRINANLRKPEFASLQVHLLDSDLEIPADEEELSSWMMRLIDNCSKFAGTDAQVTISISPHQGGVAIVTSDNGNGVESEYLSRLFQPFQRLHGGSARGHGLGLSIVSTAVQSRGGRCWAEAVVPHGLQITIWLPYAAT